MHIFVPGRICLFGEHTDWAGSYRRINGELEKGYTIISGTNHGLHAEAKSHPTKLILRSTLSEGTHKDPFEIPMEGNALLKEAEQGGFFSYAAGVAYQVMTHYRVRGLEIDNYMTDLPVKKGLSSSAAICVLVARAFNRIYDLKMTTRGEMEFAYLGETFERTRTIGMWLRLRQIAGVAESLQQVEEQIKTVRAANKKIKGVDKAVTDVSKFHRLGVAVTGSHFEVTLDGQTIITWDDPDNYRTEGYVSLNAGMCNASFDNVEVTAINKK